MRTFDFYEFVGIIVPGTVILVSAGLLFDLGTFDDLLLPTAFGSLGIHLVLAYVSGHLVQAIGNGIEWLYWLPWRGMPTDWPISRPKQDEFPKALDAICQLTHQEHPSGSHKEQRKEWKRLVGQARSIIYATGRAGRLQVFNGNYGMFRGVLAAFAVTALFGWLSSELDSYVLYPALVGLAILTGYRMHRFAKHYAKELFANAAELAKG